MKNVIVAGLAALALTACGAKEEEVVAPEAAPAVEAAPAAEAPAADAAVPAEGLSATATDAPAAE